MLRGHSDSCFVCQISHHLADGSISGHTNDRAAHKLTGKVHIHVKLVHGEFFFMDLYIILASQKSFLFCPEPDKFHGSAWSVCMKIPAEFHDNGSTCHIVISSRSLWYGIKMSCQSKDFFFFVCAFYMGDHVSGSSCHCFLICFQTYLRCSFCYQLYRIFIMNRSSRKSVGGRFRHFRQSVRSRF